MHARWTFQRTLLAVLLRKVKDIFVSISRLFFRISEAHMPMVFRRLLITLDKMGTRNDSHALSSLSSSPSTSSMSRILGVSVACWFSLLSLPAWLVAAQTIASQAYTPIAELCPEGFTLVRMAGSPENQALSPDEAAYVQARRSQVIPQAWKTYLANVEATNVTLPLYVSSILSGSSSQTPNFGIATSGGGYRAAIFGAGVLNALDGRNASSNSAGLGGLLQATSYLAGLSGGAWFVASLAQASFPTIQELIFGYPNPAAANDTWGGWNAEYNLVVPSSDPITDDDYLVHIAKELEGKYDAGYAVTLADYWARLLARHFVNGTFSSNLYNESYTHGAGILWSSVAET